MGLTWLYDEHIGCLPSLPEAGGDFAFATRLDVCQVFKGSLATNWFVAKVAIFGGVDRKNEGSKINGKAPRLSSPINPQPR